jgi:predicted O-linked N-acetylglucosamine transferase (SPINDLY family)
LKTADADRAERFYQSGLLLAQNGEFEQAIEALEEAVEAFPESGFSYHSLGVARGMVGRWEEAACAFETCLSLNPGHADTLASYALSLLECGRLNEALANAELALPGGSDSAFLHRTRGRIFAALGRPIDAAQAFQECLRLAPDDPKNLQAAGDYARDAGEESLAAELLERLCQVLPESAAAWAKCGGAYLNAGDLQPALAALRTSVRLDPNAYQLHSVMLYTSVMDSAKSGLELLSDHRHWPLGVSTEAMTKQFPNSPEPGRRLRVAILSTEFAGGSGSFFVRPLLRNHDFAKFALFGYNAGQRGPTERAGYSGLFDRWREVGELSDAEIEAVIRRDEIDILVDISGHLPGNRLGVHAHRAAPVQIAYPRYPCTTGLDAMDYRITDGWADPPGLTEPHYCETLMRLRSGYLVYDPPDCAPPVSSLPALANGYITFGFFQSPLKLNDGVFEALAGTLLAVPKSRLLFHYAVHDFDREARFARQRIENEFADRGIDPARLLFRGPLTFTDHLALLSQTDIALDSFPFNGQTNTCECLWMGVPVITLAGTRFAARVSAALLHRAGLSDWVANEAHEYSKIASVKSADLSALSSLRTGLRPKLAASTVLNGARVTREIEAAYRNAWQNWCATRKTF